MLFSSARTGKCEITSTGKMSAARTRTLGMTSKVLQTYPFSFLRIDFPTSLTPRRTILPLEATQRIRKRSAQIDTTYLSSQVSVLSSPKTYQPKALQSGKRKWASNASCCWISTLYQACYSIFTLSRIDWTNRGKTRSIRVPPRSVE